MLSVSRSDFPDGFRFGAATSAYQIEGHAFGGAGPTHWDDFAATPGNVVRREDGARACDHYHRFEEDLDLIKAAGLDMYRFSTSWARVMPDGVTVNPEGLDFYDRLVDGLLARGIEPHATLYHWELPSALADRGGWRNRDVAGWLADLTQAVMGRIGDRLASVAPINEPWCVGWLSHFDGQHAPGLRDIRATARAMHHILLAHGTATQAMRAMGMKNLGAVNNFAYIQPADDSPETTRAAAITDAHANRFFIDGMFRKSYPDEIMEAFAPHLPQNFADDFETIATPLDWFGINYYSRNIVAHADTGWPNAVHVEGPLEKTFMDWEVYPQGLHHFLTMLARDYTVDLPLFVTENGMAGDDRLSDGAVQDDQRIRFMDAHYRAALDAIADGAPLRGFFQWSLMDNYEWAFGYEKRFGLIHVDFDSLQRTPKASYHALKDALAR